ncbi:23S rRNA (pseudouridine(1915)-N(3))-methyltransferase RlmH [Candidatus Bealeia paramacronuclearis]|uniref:Ribosomal RNA large subunit methyltransferase H n=1 Tax=Candidatus Bealeia paramacronuclearis TaxID=1921001 RepID=A0ABZ2C553_9PROT|nr:23S rRNA (pseudouridine(1915)-N(3))-methyltransferase RlmH [Candidatus Bealeia paramacronuclearis]
MHITLIVLGKLKSGPFKAAIDEYQKRLSWSLTLIEIDARSKLQGEALKAYEAQEILKCIPAASFVISLDERGENLSSPEFATLFSDIQNHHQGRVTCIIGGADGLDAGVRKLSQKTISMGKLTWPHMLARVMLFEQIYRAQQILKGHPYHRE